MWDGEVIYYVCCRCSVFLLLKRTLKWTWDEAVTVLLHRPNKWVGRLLRKMFADARSHGLFHSVTRAASQINMSSNSIILCGLTSESLPWHHLFYSHYYTLIWSLVLVRQLVFMFPFKGCGPRFEVKAVHVCLPLYLFNFLLLICSVSSLFAAVVLVQTN